MCACLADAPEAREGPIARPRRSKDFPALHAFVNQVAKELGGRPVNKIVVNESYNAAYGVFGWHRVPVLWIGLPLWVALPPQERLAIIGHEIAHGVNGDATRGFIVGS